MKCNMLCFYLSGVRIPSLCPGQRKVKQIFKQNISTSQMLHARESAGFALSPHSVQNEWRQKYITHARDGITRPGTQSKFVTGISNNISKTLLILGVKVFSRNVPNFENDQAKHLGSGHLCKTREKWSGFTVALKEGEAGGRETWKREREGGKCEDDKKKWGKWRGGGKWLQ